jgi:hypothetical protein
MIEEGLYAALKAHAGIAAKTINGGAYHIYPLRLPDGFSLTSGYAITYTEISQSLTYPTARQSLFQLNCFGDTFEKARDLANDVDDCLNDLSASKLGGLYPITYSAFEGRQALYDSDAKLWYFAVEVTINY